MRIHFLQNVSHSAAHYRRNEKGMMHRGNSDKEDTSGASEIEEEKERTYRGGGGKGEARRGGRRDRWAGRRKGTSGRDKKDGGKKASLNISWNKEKCDSAEARPQHFCLYKIMYSAGLRHISQSITSSLCVSRSSISFLLSTLHSSIVSSFVVLSPGLCNRNASVLLPYRGRTYPFLRLSHAAAVSIRLCLSARVTSTPTHADSRLSADPSASIASLRRALIQIGANYRNRVSAAHQRGIISQQLIFLNIVTHTWSFWN